MNFVYTCSHYKVDIKSLFRTFTGEQTFSHVSTLFEQAHPTITTDRRSHARMRAATPCPARAGTHTDVSCILLVCLLLGKTEPKYFMEGFLVPF